MYMYVHNEFMCAGYLLFDHESRREEFHPLPYYRLLVLLWNEVLPITDEAGELHPSEPNLSSGSVHVPYWKAYELNLLVSIHNTLHLLRPSKLPAFSFAWLDLLSHRSLLFRFLKYGSVASLVPQAQGALPHHKYVLF